MSEKPLIDAIRHYQKDIERCPENKERMLRCIKRLYVMPVRVEHLQMTGVGRSVNNLREVPGEVGDAATALVAKWKAMVTAEDMNHQSEEDDSPVDEEEVTGVKDMKSNGRISPDKLEEEHSIREKENIRVNHRTDKPKAEKSENPPRHSDKHSKDKSSKHSSRIKEKDRDHSSSKDNSASKNSTNSSSDRRDKKERHTSFSKSDHKSMSDRDKSRHKDDKHKKEKLSDKHSSKDKDSKDKHSNKHSSKDKDKNRLSSSKEKDKKEKGKDDKERIKKEKRSETPEKDSRKSEKRKHKSKERDETPAKKAKHIKQEKLSSDDETDEEEVRHSTEHSASEEISNDESGPGNESEESDSDRSDSDESHVASDSESYTHVQIKQEPQSDSESEMESKRRSSNHYTSHKSSQKSSKHKAHRSGEMKPPSKSDLKALIKENEKKIKKEKPEGARDKKKSKVKIEMNQDGSIDSGSGASFADALMGFDDQSDKKKKKKKKKDGESYGEGSSKMNVVESPSGSGPSRSPSVCSNTSVPTASPIKHSKKHTSSSKHDSPPSQTPEALLKKPIKLEPLSLDISSTLPEISTNYKPLPSVPLRHTPLQTMSEEQMFSHMTSKNQRTKVYSGYKYGHTATVPSLYSFCIQVLFDNIDGLEYTGGVPFEILKPLLIKLNAEQLLNLEHYNPYLVIDTDDLWKFHCNKTFVRAVRDDLETWRETYLRCMDERELKLKRLTANISESMAKSGPARQAKLAYVDTVAKPPRNIARKQAKYGTGTSGSSPIASTSSSGSISQIAAAQNQAKKKEIVSKAVVGGFTPACQATEPVPAASFNNPVAAAKILKKKKAPLMAKALQLIKSNSRYKR